MRKTTLLLILLLSPFAGDAEAACTRIDELPAPAITESGRYCLTKNFEVDSVPSDGLIEVDADDVVVELFGHSITLTTPDAGPAITGTGNNVSVRNGFIRGFQTAVVLDGDGGSVDGVRVETAFNHAARYMVRPGERVSRGQVIGEVGSTGLSTGCHLHLMVWLNGRLGNPMSWL